MRIAVVHNAVSPGAAPDERDVLVQAEAVSLGLREAGHEPTVVECTLDLEHVRRSLGRLRADLVFNLVESLDGTGRLIHLFPSLLDAMGIPYTGSGTLALMTTSHKVCAKERMEASGVATPAWTGPYPVDLPPWPGRIEDGAAGAGTVHRWIVKSLWEHASVGLDDTAVVRGTEPEVRRMLCERAPVLGGACFAERFIEGREFNCSLLAGAHGPEVLPPAEIMFEGFSSPTPRIVDYRAKWDEAAHSYHHTPRRFVVEPGDRDVAGALARIAVRCWELFGLGGYARMDFRVGEDGTAYVLEVNANPCLSPDAGFAAAMARAGISFPEALERIVRDGVR